MTSRYERELSDRALQRAHRRVYGQAEPEMPYDPRIPIVRLLNMLLSVGLLYAVLGVWVLSLLRGVSF